MENFFHDIKALSHGAIFLATCNAILLLGTGHSLQGGWAGGFSFSST